MQGASYFWQLTGCKIQSPGVVISRKGANFNGRTSQVFLLGAAKMPPQECQKEPDDLILSGMLEHQQHCVACISLILRSYMQEARSL